jgi:hypothetical protein
MKRLTLTFFAFATFCALAYAGPEPISGKEMKQPVVAPPPCPEWYGDNEWNVSLWGTYAFAGTDFNRNTSLNEVFLTDENGGGSGRWDRFLGDDHAWGGGIDAKYFFHRYFGIGLEGFGMEAHESQFTINDFGLGGPADFHKGSTNHGVGAVLGTLTLRYPIRCTRFSPYVWAGGGGIFGGKTDREHDGSFSFDEVGRFHAVEQISHEDLSKAMGQFGGGLEIRITRHIGWMGDFSWCVLDGPDNNFGMVRTGLTFAF